MNRFRLVAAAVVAAVALVVSSVPAVGAIYGDVDIYEYGEVSAGLQGVADRVLVMISDYQIDCSAQQNRRSRSGTCVITGVVSSELENIAPDDPMAEYRSQTEAGFCTGFLAGSTTRSGKADIVATADYCLESFSCDSFLLVLGWKVETPGRPAPTVVSADDVYSCRRVVAETNGVALIQLDRATKEWPLCLGHGEQSDVGTPVAGVGHSWGLPVKISTGGTTQIRSVTSTAFQVNLDLYAGAGGGPVVDVGTYEVLGIYHTGNQDFNLVAGVYYSYIFSDINGASGLGGSGWEEARSVDQIIDDIPLTKHCYKPKKK